MYEGLLNTTISKLLVFTAKRVFLNVLFFWIDQYEILLVKNAC